MFHSKRVYLDFAAATPLSKAASRAMNVVLKQTYGNPSAIHSEGRAAKQLLETARTTFARTVQVRPEFVTFTSGGTESNSLAILGLTGALAASGRVYTGMEVITTLLEHPSVGEAMLELKKRGVTIHYVSVSEVGVINTEHFKSLLNEKTVLVSVSHVNSEIGTIQPLHRLRKIMNEQERVYNSKMYLHVDAAQSPLWLSCQFAGTNADLLSLDFGKCGGPKGVGALVCSPQIPLKPILFGGGQEGGLRPGTEPVAQVVGGVTAFVEAQASYQEVAKRVTKIRDEGIKLISRINPQAVLNGAMGEARVANNINLSIPGVDTEFLTVVLDAHGIAVSTKSACAGAGSGESMVVKTISNDDARARSTLRLTLGPSSNINELKRVAAVIEKHLKQMEQWQ